MNSGLRHKTQSNVADDEGDEGFIKPQRDWNGPAHELITRNNLDETFFPIQPEDLDPSIVLGTPIDKTGTIRVPLLIEEKLITTPTSLISFLDLDGNTDQRYVIYYDIRREATVTDSVFYMRFNNATSGYRSTVQRWWAGTDAPGSYTDKLGITYQGVNTNTVYQNGEIKIDAITNRYKKFYADGVGRSADETIRFAAGGSWEDNTNNLTQIDIGVSNGTFTGVIGLYKLAKLVIG